MGWIRGKDIVDSPWAPDRERRYVREREVNATASWNIAQWCLENGSTEFTIRVIEIVGQEQDPSVEQQIEALQPFSIASQTRPRLTTEISGRKFRYNTELWRLTTDSVAILHEVFPLGLLVHVMGNSGWIEDPAFYRDEELMFGVVSHENEGVVQGTTTELAGLAIYGITLRDKPDWIWSE